MRQDVTFGSEESPCTGWLYQPDKPKTSSDAAYDTPAAARLW
jgi:hypothetical protein